MNQFSLGRLSFIFSAITILLTACSTPPLHNEDQIGGTQIEGIQFLDLQGMINEYQKAAQNLELPEGYSYPKNPFENEEDGGFYEQGSGENDAVFLWNCAWGKEWLNTRGVDEERAAEAFAIYASVRDTDTYKRAWDPESIQEPFEAALEAAQLGDASAIQEDIMINCPK